MTRSSQKSGLRLWCGTISVALLFLVIGPQTAEAQTNTFPTTGNAGVGTTTPGSLLEVKQSQNAGTTVVIDNGHTAASNAAYSGFFFKQAGASRFFFGSNNDGNTAQNGGAGAVQFWNYANGPMLFATYNAERMRINSAGNVGIGTTSPTAKLHLIANDDTVAPALSIRQDSNPAYGFDFALDTNVNGNLSVKRVNNGTSAPMMVLDRAGGNVGIGTASPTSPLFVAGNEPSTDYATLRVKPTVTHGGIVIDSANNTSQAHLRFFKSGVPKWQFRVPFQDGVEDLRLYSWAASSDVLSIMPSGNVGIGTTSPTKKLDVLGDINASGTITGGTITAKYQDVAEWVESSQALTAGTVVVLDHTRSNQVIASSKAYDTRVAGVISLQPGIALGESGAGKVLVATTGRVKIKVDASAGPIQIGDLLVTSDVSGLAMKSEAIKVSGRLMHMPGTLVGKALEPLEKGTGEILVLLSLQ